MSDQKQPKPDFMTIASTAQNRLMFVMSNNQAGCVYEGDMNKLGAGIAQVLIEDDTLFGFFDRTMELVKKKRSKGKTITYTVPNP